jgi:hypothetical protein
MLEGAKTIAVNPGVVLVTSLSRVQGGRTTTRRKIREDPEGNALETEANVTVRIENVTERANAEALVQEATHIIRKNSTHTVIGYLTDEGRIQAMNQAFHALKGKASDFNASAITCHVEIGFLPIAIATALGAEAARALADHVRGELETLRDSLKAGDHKKARAILLPTRAGNLKQLATGPQADAIEFALEEGREALKTIKDRIKEGSGGVSETPESVGKSLDLPSIENAIEMFRYVPVDTTPAERINTSV